MRITCTGFLPEQAGSFAGANALLLRTLVERGVGIDFFSEPSFVDPRPVIGERRGFRFLPTVNTISDHVHRKAARLPLVGFFASRRDKVSYNRLLLKRIRQEHQRRSCDLCLWLGDYAWGLVPGVPTVSFVQGPVGTDARSVLQRGKELQRVCGNWLTLKWTALARLRLSPLGLPGFHYSDSFIVGSEQSRRTLGRLYGIKPALISIVPYPVDLNLFSPLPEASLPEAKTLRVLWLGRIVPQKTFGFISSGGRPSRGREEWTCA